MKVMIVYPHGIGDCILATPALREYKQKTGNYIGFAMMERLRSSELFKHNPYIDALEFTKDPWNDYGTYRAGIQDIVRKFYTYGYDEIIFVDHPAPHNKIMVTAERLGITLDNVHTEVYISEQDEAIAEEFLKSYGVYGFAHSQSPSNVTPPKNLPNGFARKWLMDNCDIDDVIEVGVDFTPTEFNINVQFAILKRASFTVLIDSAFYHAAGAMDKKIDFCYFGPREKVYKRVHPLHVVDQNIVFDRIG